MCTLADPTLTQKSSVVVCDGFKVDMLLVSPDRKWIFAGTKDSKDLSPKVFTYVFPALVCPPVLPFTTNLAVGKKYPHLVDFCRWARCQVIHTESLTSPSEGEDPLCQSVPVTGCQAAVFMPTQPARLALVHQGPWDKALTVFDVAIQKSKYKSEIQGEERDVAPDFDTL